MDIDAYVSKFEKMDVGAVEEWIRNRENLSLESQMEAMIGLHYLETTLLWKNGRDKYTDFFSYIMERHGFSKNIYQFRIWATKHCHDEILEYGWGTVKRVMMACGKQRTKAVFREIRKAEPLRRSGIDTIIEKERTIKRKPRINWRQLYLNELTAHEVTKKKLNELEKELQKERENHIKSKNKKLFRDIGKF